LEQRGISRQELCELATAAFALVIQRSQDQRTVHSV